MSSDKFDQRILELVNEERSKAGLDSLSIDSQLDQAANLHTDEMVQAGYISHQLPGEPWLDDRIKATGYKLAEPTDSIPYPGNENVGSLRSSTTDTSDESIASLSEFVMSPEKAFDGWMNSPGHRANILNPDYTHIGIGYGSSDDGDDVENYDSSGDFNDLSAFYTQVFATPESIDI